MQSAFIYVNPSSFFPKSLARWIRPRVSYSEITANDTFSFLLCTVSLPEKGKDSALVSFYQKIAARLKKLRIAYVMTNAPSPSFFEVFSGQFGFAIPDGQKIKQLLLWPITKQYFKENNLSLSHTPIAIYVSKLTDGRKAFLEKMAQTCRYLTVITNRFAALSGYLESIYAETGISVPLRPSQDISSYPIVILLDSFCIPPGFKGQVLSFTTTSGVLVLFENESIFPLFCGILPSLGAAETEFLLHSMIHHPFPHSAEHFFRYGFSLAQVSGSIY